MARKGSGQVLSTTVKKPAAFRLSLETPVNGTTTTQRSEDRRGRNTKCRTMAGEGHPSIRSFVCGWEDESDQQILFQNGEAGLMGEAFSLLTSVQSCTKPKDVSLLLFSSFRSIAGSCWPKVLPHLGCVTMTSSYSCRLCPCLSHASQNITFLC